MAIFIYKRYETSPGTWRQLHWDTDTRTAYETTISGSSTEVLYDDNIIVDLYQLDTNRVVLITYNSLVNGLVTPSSYPRLFLSGTVVSGVSGDNRNTLLFKRCNTLDSPPTFEYGIFSRTVNDAIVVSYPLSQAPFCYAFAISEELIIKQYCVGTTLRRIYYDGEDDVTVVDAINSVICGYVAPIPEVVVTEVKRIKIDHACYDNPIYLVWRNTLGGWDHWLFSKTQTKGLITEDLGTFEQPEYDLATSEGSSDSLGSTAGDSLILGADNLTTNQYDAIRELLFSPKIYQVETDSTKKKVLVKPGSFTRETRNGFHSIEFEISLPDINTVKS